MMHRATQKWRKHRRPQVLGGVAVVVLAATAGVTRGGEHPPPPDVSARETYAAAAVEFEGSPEDAEAAWRFGRACFDWAEFATNHQERASIAEEGIVACETALRIDANVAAAHYYLGMNQGQLARTKGLGALKLVHEMAAHFEQARELDAAFDQAGPDRNLGLLYLEAPGWPVSVGNRDKASEHLKQAVQVAPHFPENRLNLMDAYARWEQRSKLKHELDAFDKQLEAAREKFSGSRWYWEWVRWEDRLTELREKAATSSRRLRSPRDSG